MNPLYAVFIDPFVQMIFTQDLSVIRFKQTSYRVIPAKAGIQGQPHVAWPLDPRFRWDDSGQRRVFNQAVDP